MRSAFTLVEVIVVLTILAILAALVTPVYGRAKQSSQEAVSISNMRQLFTAVELYRQDYDAKPFGSQEDMALPNDLSTNYLPGVSHLHPPRRKKTTSYYYYPIPKSIDRRRPTWEEYTLEHGGRTVLLADPWFNPEEVRTPYPHYIYDPMVTKYLIGIDLNGSRRSKRASGHLDLAWWDR